MSPWKNIFTADSETKRVAENIKLFHLLCFLFCAVNVAYGKAANISSRFINSAGANAGPGCMAVNGKTETTYKSVTESGSNCVHTAKTDYNPWWLVDLGLNYSVLKVTIYNRQSKEALTYTILSTNCINLALFL